MTRTLPEPAWQTSNRRNADLVLTQSLVDTSVTSQDYAKSRINVASRPQNWSAPDLAYFPGCRFEKPSFYPAWVRQAVDSAIIYRDIYQANCKLRFASSGRASATSSQPTGEFNPFGVLESSSFSMPVYISGPEIEHADFYKSFLGTSVVEWESIGAEEVLFGQGSTLVLSKERQELLVLINEFLTDGLSWSSDYEVKISLETADAAKALFSVLKPNAVIPKISPNGDGGLMLVWKSSGGTTLLVVDGWKLHLVTAATTPQAKYLDDVPFDGCEIPASIHDSIPEQ